jgi:uncharacterized protein (DUF1697 family)
VTTYVALRRGINLGPRNKIAMADLRETTTNRNWNTTAKLLELAGD